MKKSSEHVLNETQTPYAAASGIDLEFPDWSGHRQSRAKVTEEEMLRYCESVLPLVKRKPGYEEMRRRTACYVEFSLD